MKNLFSLVLPLGLASIWFCSANAEDLSQPAPAPRRPSIVLIVADGVGYGDLGCYGQKDIHTPNLDQLASEGMRFTSAYAGSADDSPSRAALMTGRDSGHLRIRGDADQSLGGDEVTIGQLLKLAGYSTAAIGKWGLGGEGTAGAPAKEGFDEWAGLLTRAEAEEAYPPYVDSTGAGTDGRIAYNANMNELKTAYADDIFTTAALSFLRIKKPDRFNHYKSFFLYLGYTIPRANNEPRTATSGGISDEPYSGESWPPGEKSRAAMITRMDVDIGRIMKQLRDLKVDGNTLVIFTSNPCPRQEAGVDPSFFKSAGLLRAGKQGLYEGNLRVPLIARMPGLVPGGVTSDYPCAFWDFLPTMMEIAWRKPPENIQGISIYPTLTGGMQTNRHDFLYWELHENGFSQAVRTGDWKAIRHGLEGALELYDLKSDVAEKNDLANQHPDMVAKIMDYLKTARTDDRRWPAESVAQTAKKPADSTQ